MSTPKKLIPEKVLLWLTDPFIIEVPGLVPPGNGRIVPLGSAIHESTPDKDRSHESIQPSPVAKP